MLASQRNFGLKDQVSAAKWHPDIEEEYFDIDSGLQEVQNATRGAVRPVMYIMSN